MSRGRKYYKYEYVKDYIESFEGYKLISKDYIGARSKLEIKCPKNHIFQKTYNNFQRGQRCPECSGKKKLTYDYVKNYIESFDGYQLLSKEYINTRIKLLIRCKEGHENLQSFDTFKFGSRCLKCSIPKRAKKRMLTYEHVKEYVESVEGYKLVSTDYSGSQENIEMKCPKNHTVLMTYNNFQRGSRCFKCSYIDFRSGSNHPKWIEDRSRRTRLKTLLFNLNNIDILKDDINYYNYKQDRFNYNVDHIFPRKAFIDNDLDINYDMDIIYKICNSRNNLQIITKKANIKKHGKYNQKQFINWFNIQLQENS